MDEKPPTRSDETKSRWVTGKAPAGPGSGKPLGNCAGQERAWMALDSTRNQAKVRGKMNPRASWRTAAPRRRNKRPREERKTQTHVSRDPTAEVRGGCAGPRRSQQSQREREAQPPRTALLWGREHSTSCCLTHGDSGSSPGIPDGILSAEPE